MSTVIKSQDTILPPTDIVPSGERTVSTLLHIDASARVNGWIIRDLSAKFIETWMTTRPDGQVIRRDIGQNRPCFVTEEWIAAGFRPPNERTTAHRAVLAESDELIAEIVIADIIVRDMPM